MFFFFFSSRRRHTRWNCDWSSDVCSSDLASATFFSDAGSVASAASSSVCAQAGLIFARRARTASSLSRLRPASAQRVPARSEERRVGKEWRSRWSPYHEKKKKQVTGDDV